MATTVGPAWACPSCATSEEVWWQIGANSPAVILGVLACAFTLVAVLIALLARMVRRCRLLAAGALLLGAGMGGLVDGIVLHQVLQWHAMISSRLPPTDLVASKVNMFWDGVFHGCCWVTVVVALVILVHELQKSVQLLAGRIVASGALAGWGIFNVVEGLLDHQLMGLHHVHPGVGETTWDAAFLGVGVVMMLVGGRALISQARL